MSHAQLEAQIKILPEECLDEVSRFIEYLIYRQKMIDENKKNKAPVECFGSIKDLPDGMDFQKEVRNEWN